VIAAALLAPVGPAVLFGGWLAVSTDWRDTAIWAIAAACVMVATVAWFAMATPLLALVLCLGGAA
jgi:hypothetical protein